MSHIGTHPHEKTSSRESIFSTLGTSVLSALRTATTKRYEKFSSDVLSDKTIISRESYIKHLHQFHEASSKCMAHMNWSMLEEMGLGHVKERRARYENIAADLVALNEDVPTLPLFTPKSEKQSVTPAESVGCVFVLEGGIHMGRDIAAAFLKADIGITQKETSFLRGFGPKTHNRWIEFINWLEELEGDADFRAEACQAAKKSFKILTQSLTPSSK